MDSAHTHSINARAAAAAAVACWLAYEKRLHINRYNVMLLYPPCSCCDIIPVFLSPFDSHSAIHLFVHSLCACTLLHSIPFRPCTYDCAPLLSFFFSLTQNPYTHSLSCMRSLLRLRLARSVAAHRRRLLSIRRRSFI